MLEIKLELKQIEEKESEIGRLKKRVEALNSGYFFDKDLGRELALIMHEDLNRRFMSAPATEVGGIVHGNVQWQKLSDVTFRLHPKRYGGKVHIDTGRLWRACVTPGSQSVYELKDNQFKFEILVDYASKLQQWRPILFLHEELMNKIAEKMTEYIINDRSNKPT